MSNKKYSDISKMDHTWVSPDVPEQDQNSKKQPDGSAKKVSVARVEKFFRRVLLKLFP
jgi:hypothetical protein